MAVRKDGMENWITENGIFIVCPLEHLAERLGIPEQEIEDKLGNVHGIVTVNAFSKISVNKSYGICEKGNFYYKIELDCVKNCMNDEVPNIIRYLQDDEMIFDEYKETQKHRLENLNANNLSSMLAVYSDMQKEYDDIIVKKT